ncbi:MAG: hypothetical protein RIS94_1264 [Pseudomonadota bacterium]|jgi:DNA-binding CsgD family transcriptional regulator/PAS domain-containing protein
MLRQKEGKVGTSMGLRVDESLLGQLYRTPDCEQAWLPLLDELCARFRVRNAAVQLLRARADRLDQEWMVRDSYSVSQARAHDRWLAAPDNLRLSRAGSYPPPPISSDARIFGDDPKALASVHSGLDAIGLGAGFWTSFPLGEGRHVTMILHRAAGDYRDIQDAEEGFLRTFLPHLRQAVHLSTRLRDLDDAADRYRAAAGAVDSAMLVCDADLRVEWCNGPAEAILAASPHLSQRQGRLWTPSGATMKALRDLVHRQIDHPAADGLMALGQPGMTPLQVRAAEVRRNARADDAVLLLLAQPETVRLPSSQDLARLFGLTGAEAQLAAALAAGETVRGYAGQRGTTEGTVRVQLKQVLAKTGAARQSDLVRMIFQSVAMQARAG